MSYRDSRLILPPMSCCVCRVKKSQTPLASLRLSTTSPPPREEKSGGGGSDLVRYGVNKAARERNRFEKDSISVGGGRGLLCHPSGGGG